MKAVVRCSVLIAVMFHAHSSAWAQVPSEPPRPPPPSVEPPASPAADPSPEAPAAPVEASAEAPAEVQTEQPDPATAALPEVEGEIVVTAQKRQEKLLEVPISISVVSPDALKASGAKNLSELQGVKPGVYFSGNTSYGGAPMAIRGTAGSNTALLDDPVAVYLDGVYLASGSFSSATLLDVGGIEILRGPQGTLQGRNATAGAVIVRSADPKFNLGGYGRASLATPLEYRLEAAAGGPLLDTLAARVAVAYHKERGWAENTFDDSRLGSSESLLGRLVLLFEPIDPLRLRLATSYSVVEAEPALARWAETNVNPDPNGPLLLPPPSPFQPTPTTPLDPEDREAIEDGQFALNRRADAETRTFFNAFEASYTFDDFADLISVTGLILTDTRGFNDSDGLARVDREGFNSGEFETQSVSEELRLQSNTEGPLGWLLGAYYSHSHQDMLFRIFNLQFTQPPGDRRFTTFDAEQDNTTLAGFTDVTYRILPMLAATAGVRYTYERKSFKLNVFARNFETNEPIIPPPPAPGAPPPPPPTKSPTSWNDVSYRGKLSFTPIESLLVYASFSKGFKSGGYNAFGQDPAFDPEELWSGELGAKYQLPERRGWLSVAGYRNHYDSLQIRAGVPGGGVAIRNAADSRIDGLEFEGDVRVVGGLSLQGNVAYANARFESFPLAVDLLNPTTTFDAAGNRLPRAPRWQFFAQASYDQSIAEDWGARAEVSYRWRDKVYYYHTNQDSLALQGEPLGELGARISVFYDPLALSLAVFGTNLTDDRSVNGFNPNFNYPEVSFNKPRVLGVEVEKKF